MLNLLQKTCTEVLTEPNVWCQTIIKPTMNMAIAAANCVPMPWKSCIPAAATDVVYVDGVGATFMTGEHVILTVSPVINSRQQSQIVGQILRVRRSHVKGRPKKEIQVLFYPEESSLPTLPTRLSPPDSREFVEYPAEVVRTNLVGWVDTGSIVSEAFVFLESSIDSNFQSPFGVSVGMTNAFCLRYRWNSSTSCFSCVGAHHPFPKNNGTSYSQSRWRLVSDISLHVQRSLWTVSLNQRNSKSFGLSADDSDWAYLKTRLAPIKCHDRDGMACSKMMRPRGTAEVTKSASTTSRIHIDTFEKIEVLKTVCGNSITIGPRLPPPKAPSLRGGAQVNHSFGSLRTVDFVNCILDLPVADISTEEAYRPNTTETPGIYLSFCLCRRPFQLQGIVRYKRRKVTYVSVLSELDISLETPATSHEVGVEEQQFDIEIGTQFQAFNAVFEVDELEENEVVCVVLESENTDFIVDSNRTFTRAEANHHLNMYFNS